MSYYHPSYHFLFVEQVCGSQYQLPAVEAPKFQWPTGNYSGQNLEITESIVDEWLRNFCNLRHLPSVYMVKKNKQRKVFLWRLCRWTSFWLAPGFNLVDRCAWRRLASRLYCHNNRFVASHSAAAQASELALLHLSPDASAVELSSSTTGEKSLETVLFSSCWKSYNKWDK